MLPASARTIPSEPPADQGARSALSATASGRPRVLIAGDYSGYHCGSAAVMDVLRREAGARGVLVGTVGYGADRREAAGSRVLRRMNTIRRHALMGLRDEFDVLIVNGEGTMHHGRINFYKNMTSIVRAVLWGKEVRLVNTVWEDNPHLFDPILRRCSEIIVREVLSQRALARHGVFAKAVPDFSYFREIGDDPIRDFGGKIVFTDFFSPEFKTFVTADGPWTREHAFLDMKTLSWSSLVRSLPTARLLVTGRHHAVYAAIKARVPFVALRGNSHKIEGIIETAGARIPVCRSLNEVEAAIGRVQEFSGEYRKLFDWYARQEPWRFERASALRHVN